MILEETLVPDIAPAAEKVVDTPEPTLREQLETASKEAGDRARDEAGRFAAKPKEDGVVADPAAKLGEIKPEVAAKPALETPAPETPERPTLAPNAWSHQAKAAFANADPLIKAEIAKREADIHREFTRQDAERNMGKAVSQAVAPYAQMIQAEGGNPLKAFQGYLETTRILRHGDSQTKAQLGRQLFQQFGIDPAVAFGEGFANTGAQNQVAPETQMLQNKIENLEAQVSRFGSYAENQALAPLQATIEAFGKDPANAHFELVKPEMAALLQAGRAQSLQDAYDMAVWARPDIRSSLIAQQQQAAEAKRVADAKAKADAARRAGGSVTGSPGLGASADPKAGQRTLRQELEANLSSARI